MTLFYMTIDLEKNQIDWVRAGHDPALVYTPETDGFEELKGTGIALGVTDHFEYMEHHKEGLENGQIIEEGNHSELLALGGNYFHLYSSGFEG